MSVFNWAQYPDAPCLTCMSQENSRGFVNFYSEVNIMRDGYEIAGVADTWYCATCLEQAAALIGSPMRSEAEAWAYKEKEYQENEQKLKDEVQSWQQRLMGLANLSVKDFQALAQLEQMDEPKPTPPFPTPTQADDPGSKPKP